MLVTTGFFVLTFSCRYWKMTNNTGMIKMPSNTPVSSDPPNRWRLYRSERFASPGPSAPFCAQQRQQARDKGKGGHQDGSQTELSGFQCGACRQLHPPPCAAVPRIPRSGWRFWRASPTSMIRHAPVRRCLLSTPISLIKLRIPRTRPTGIDNTMARGSI